MTDYISERAGPALPRWHRSWQETVRERITYVAPDDDINYTILGMLLLEQHGLDLTREHVRDAWVRHLPIGTTFGPERPPAPIRRTTSEGKWTPPAAPADGEKPDAHCTIAQPPRPPSPPPPRPAQPPRRIPA